MKFIFEDGILKALVNDGPISIRLLAWAATPQDAIASLRTLVIELEKKFSLSPPDAHDFANAHDELVAALRELLERAENFHVAAVNFTDFTEAKIAMQRARMALAKACTKPGER